MTPEELRTLTLFNSVARKPEINQRQLARELDVSLGLANTYFQRVLKKGWIRAKKVKPRRWLYFLTPKGVFEKSRLSLSYMSRTLNSFRELKNKGDKQLQILSNEGFSGIHLFGEDDLTEVLSYCFSGHELKLLSIISEKLLIDNINLESQPDLPKLKSNELIMLASLEHVAILSEFLTKSGLQKNKQWIIFS